MNIRVDDDTVIAGRHVARVRRFRTDKDHAVIRLEGADCLQLWSSVNLENAEADALFQKCSASLGERSAD